MSTGLGQTTGQRRPENRVGPAAAGINAISRTRTTRFIGLAVATLVGLVGSLAIATPAEARVPGLIRVSATSGSTSDDQKTMVALCPAGKQLVGTGAAIVGGGGKVVIAQLWPNGSPTAAPTSVTAVAEETDPISQTWSLTVYGICANPLPGLVRISVRSSDNQSEPIKTALAMCPNGKNLVGTGFSIAHGHGQVSVGGVRFLDPVENLRPNHVFVHAHEVDHFVGDWWLYAHAICADYLYGLRVHSRAVTSVPYTGSSVVAACPPGQVLLGAGFWIQVLQPYPDLWLESVLDDFAPNGGSTTAPTSVRVTHYEEDPPGAWIATAYAICAYESGY